MNTKFSIYHELSSTWYKIYKGELILAPKLQQTVCNCFAFLEILFASSLQIWAEKEIRMELDTEKINFT